MTGSLRRAKHSRGATGFHVLINGHPTHAGHIVPGHLKKKSSATDAKTAVRSYQRRGELVSAASSPGPGVPPTTAVRGWSNHSQ